MKKWIIPICIEIILFVMFLINNYAKLEFNPEYKYIYMDALGTSGIILLLFSGFIWVTQEGTFDILIFGTKKFFRYIFNPKSENNKQTYLEYVEERRETKKLPIIPSIIVSLVPLITYIILAIIGLEF